MDRLPSALVKRARNVSLPFAALTAISEIRSQLRALEDEAIKTAREAGATWDSIAEALGITRQALQQRLMRSPKRPLT